MDNYLQEPTSKQKSPPYNWLLHCILGCIESRERAAQHKLLASLAAFKSLFNEVSTPQDYQGLLPTSPPPISSSKQSEDSWLLALTVKTRQDLAFILRQKENTKECQWCSGNMYPFQGWARGPIPLWRKLFAISFLPFSTIIAEMKSEEQGYVIHPLPSHALD